MRLLFSVLVALAALASTAAAAVQLQVDASAIEKLLKAQAFRDGGKWRLGKSGKCNNPYLEHPSVTIRQGRLFIRAHFAGRMGSEVMGSCVSMGEPSWLTVSGRPVVDGQMLSIGEVRVDEVEKPSIRPLAVGLLESATRSALKIDLQNMVRSLVAPANTAPYLVDISGLNMMLMQADQNRLRFSLDFGVAVR